jgi:phage shock protein A
MTSLLDDINTLIQTSLDDVISNPDCEDCLQALDAYGRQMEGYLDVLEEMTGTLGKGVKRLRRKQRQFEALAGEAGESARQFHREGQNNLARAAQDRMRVMQQASQAFQEEADLQNDRFRALMDVKLRLEARLTEVAQKRTALQMTPSPDRNALLAA